MTPLWSIRAPLRLGLFALVVLVLGFGRWAVFGTLAGAVIAPGLVEVEHDRQVVEHPKGGVVTEILVREGDHVKTGAPLLRLDAGLLTAELAIVENRLFELMAQRARLEAEQALSTTAPFAAELQNAARKAPAVADMLTAQTRLLHTRLQQLSDQREQLGRRRQSITAEIKGLAALTSATQEQRALVQKELEGQQKLLGKGLAQAARIFALEREAARFKGRIAEAKTRKASAEGQLQEIDLQEGMLTAELRQHALEELREIGPQETELRERRLNLSSRIARLTLTAPSDGVVFDMAVTTPQAVLRPASPALYIIPDSEPLIVTARVSPLHIDKAYEGQKVTLRFPALDEAETPERQGEVLRISAHRLERSADLPAHFSVKIRLLRSGTRARSDALRPGMPAEVLLLTAEHSPMHFLLKPLLDQLQTALRG